MGRCCVPMCRGNYDGGPKVRLFSFPRDPKRRDDWKRAVRRDDVDVAQLKDPKLSEIVCERHFKPQYLRTTSTYTDVDGRTIEAPMYCLHEVGFRYVLLGKFQTDPLEARFGRYRQLCGSHYNVSITQVFEAETKIGLQNTLIVEDMPLSKLEEKALNAETLIRKYNVTLTEDNLKTAAGDMHAITYSASYCAYAALKRQPCDDCRTQLTIEDRELEMNDHLLIDTMSRGGLKFPKPFVVQEKKAGKPEGDSETADEEAKPKIQDVEYNHDIRTALLTSF
ncbi:uncharacterized protein LOC144168002 [Haemaphysalis longicornis]